MGVQAAGVLYVVERRGRVAGLHGRDSLAALTNVLEGHEDEKGTECRLGETTRLVFEFWRACGGGFF